MAVTLTVTAVAQNPFQGFPAPLLDVPEAPPLPNGNQALPAPQALSELAPIPELRPFKPDALPTFTPLNLPERPHFRWPARLALTEPLPEAATPDELLANLELIAINRGANPSVALRLDGRVSVVRVGQSAPGFDVTVTALTGNSVTVSNGKQSVELTLEDRTRAGRGEQ